MTRKWSMIRKTKRLKTNKLIDNEEQEGTNNEGEWIMSNGSSNSSCSSSSATNPASRSDGGLGGGGIMSSSNYTPPTLVPYYFGRLLREESNRVLEKQGAAEGLFLLRELVIECGSYALSICSGGVCHHYKIERCDDGFVKIEKGRKFIGPVELVKHHQFELDGLLVKPLVPCIRSLIPSFLTIIHGLVWTSILQAIFWINLTY